MQATMFITGVVGLWLAIGTYSEVAAELPDELARWLGPQTWERDTAGPIVSLGNPGDFDDRHIFAPAVAEEQGRFLLWYSGSRGTPGERVFRLGLATSTDGKRFEKSPQSPVLQSRDGMHSILTPALLRSSDGTVLREHGKLQMWFSSATLGKGGLHTLHMSNSNDGIQWSEPSPTLLENVYCPTVLKTEAGYQMWYSDVSRRPWLLRHATSSDGSHWQVTARPVLQLSQPWEAEVLVYPTVIRIDGVYLMWYGSYDSAVRRETTAIGFAVSLDGLRWTKHPQNPVLRPDPQRPWESNEDDVIIRAWYWSSTPLPKEPTAAEDATFVDLWVHGLDTSRLAARTPAQLPQVFQVTGNKLFDTTCGRRSLPLLEPVDLAHYGRARNPFQTGN